MLSIPLTKASDIINLRKNDRRHSIDIIGQVIRLSPPNPSYKFFTCEVQDDEYAEARKQFSFKVWKSEFNQVENVVAFDIIRICHGVKKVNDRRSSSGYAFTANDIKSEIHAHEHSIVEILFSPAHQINNCFAFIKGPMAAIQLRGIVDKLPEKSNDTWYFMVNDKYENVLEIQTNGSLDVKVGDNCTIRGDSIYSGKFIVVVAESVSKTIVSECYPDGQTIVVYPPPEPGSTAVGTIRPTFKNAPPIVSGTPPQNVATPAHLPRTLDASKIQKTAETQDENEPPKSKTK